MVDGVQRLLDELLKSMANATEAAPGEPAAAIERVLRTWSDSGAIEPELAEGLHKFADVLGERAAALGRARDDRVLAVAQLDAILSHAPVGLGFFDRDLRFIHANEALAAIDGLPIEEHLGRHLSEIVPELWPTLRGPHLQVLASGLPVVDLEVSGPTAAEPGVERHWLVNLYPVDDPGGGIAGLGVIVVEISEQKRAERQARLLGRASELFARTQDMQETLIDAAAIAVPDLADACVVVVDDDPRPPLIGTAGEAFDLPAELTPDQRARVRAGDVLVLEPAPGAGWRAAVVAPLRSSGMVVGAMYFVRMESSRLVYSDADIAVARQLASRVGLVVNNARFAELARRAQARLELLASAGALVERGLDVHERAQFLARLAVPEFGDHALVFVHDPEGDELVMAAAAHRDDTMAKRLAEIDWPRFEPSGYGAVSTAFRTGTTVVRPPRLDGGAVPTIGDPDLARALAATSCLAVPLRDGAVRMGVLFFAYGPSGRAYDESDVALAEELGRLAAPAIGNAQRFERERLTGEALQLSLLPQAVPSVAGAWIAARYLPGTVGLHVGGDWFDVLDLGDEGILLVIGDVVGHGIEAATTMGRYRTALQFAASQGHEPYDVLRRINDFMCAAFHTEMATLCLARYDPATGRAWLASAGHLPPLVLAPDGTATVTTIKPGLPLGVESGAEYPQVVVDVPVGGGLVLYTDGLVERRGEVLDDGIARLVHASDQPLIDPEVIADRLVERLVAADGATDDVALLVARMTIAGPRLSVAFNAHPRALAPMRRDLRTWLARWGMTEERVEDVVLAVDEAAANSIEHAYPEEALGPVEIDGELVGGAFEISVRDRGCWKVPRPRMDRGRGTDIMRALVDDVDIQGNGAGTTVRLIASL